MGKEFIAFFAIGLALLGWYSQIVSDTGSVLILIFGLVFFAMGLLDLILTLRNNK